MYKVVIVLSLIAILLAVLSYISNLKSKKKLKSVLEVLKGKESLTLNDFQTKVIDIEDVDDNELMKNLYEIYITFQNKFNELNQDYGELLTDSLKQFYENLVKSYKLKECKDITDKIDLIGYSILDYNDSGIKFRVKIKCLNYKISNDKIVSGSNVKKIEQILIITYKKEDKWKISNIEKIYEK